MGARSSSEAPNPRDFRMMRLQPEQRHKRQLQGLPSVRRIAMNPYHPAQDAANLDAAAKAALARTSDSESLAPEWKHFHTF